MAGEPWMLAHELTELDQGSVASLSRFSSCGSEAKDSWPRRLLAAELAAPTQTAFSCMSGTADILVPKLPARHPWCADHVEVRGATHGGILRAPETIERARVLLGGTYATSL